MACKNVVTSTIPTFSCISASPQQAYSLFLIDLSINIAQINTSQLSPGVQLPLTPGINAGRTTRLHYWQPGIRFTSNGSLVNTTEPIAYYQGPAPPPGDGPHTYALYLFEQGPGFVPPPAGSPFSAALVNGNQGLNRVGFNVNQLASEKAIGPLVAANYLVSQTGGSTKSSLIAAATGTSGIPNSAGTSNATASYSPSSFTSNARTIRTGLVGGVVTFTASGATLLCMLR